MFKLVIEDDEGNKTVVPIIRDEITIGRQDGNTIRLTERNVSRDHARLVRLDGDVYLEEVSARYGTRKNGDRVDGRTEFGVGDVFSIGDYRLTLQSDVVPEAKPPALPKKNGATPPPLKTADDEPTRVARSDTATRSEGTEIIPANPAQLVIVSSNFAGQEFPLARKEMVIGRGEECDIIIDHRSVSQKHAKVIREQSGEYKIVDLKSKNGVKVGGEEYRAVHLKRGDIIELGHVKFRFVESGENYVFTPHADDEFKSGSSKVPLLVIAGVLIVAVSLVAVYLFLDGARQEPVAIAGANTADAVAATADNPTPAEAAESDLDQKIAKAEQDYLAGRVQKASGMLELLRGEEEITPEQVEAIDSLLSKTKREKGFVRYFENGKDHYEAERWLEALAEFRQIPDDDELNIYRLIRDGRYIDTAVANATETELERAKNADGDTDRAEARDNLAELQAMFPSHIAPPEAIAELAAVRPPKPKSERKRPPTPSTQTSEPEPQPTTTKPSPANLLLADDLHQAAIRAMLAGDHEGAISKARAAIDNGCTTKCYRVVGMAYFKLGEQKKACSWLAKAGSELPSGLDCP